MPLNTSGPISLAGNVTGQSIALELNQSATGQISLNDTNVRTLANVLVGAITIPTDFYGKSSGPGFFIGWVQGPQADGYGAPVRINNDIYIPVANRTGNIGPALASGSYVLKIPTTFTSYTSSNYFYSTATHNGNVQVFEIFYMTVDENNKILFGGDIGAPENNLGVDSTLAILGRLDPDTLTITQSSTAGRISATGSPSSFSAYYRKIGATTSDYIVSAFSLFDRLSVNGTFRFDKNTLAYIGNAWPTRDYSFTLVNNSSGTAYINESGGSPTSSTTANARASFGNANFTMTATINTMAAFNSDAGGVVNGNATYGLHTFSDGTAVLMARNRGTTPSRGPQWVRRFNSSGTTLWTKTYTNTVTGNLDNVTALGVDTSDCFYFATRGFTGTGNTLVINKVDINGNIIFSRSLELVGATTWGFSSWMDNRHAITLQPIFDGALSIYINTTAPTKVTLILRLPIDGSGTGSYVLGTSPNLTINYNVFSFSWADGSPAAGAASAAFVNTYNANTQTFLSTPYTPSFTLGRTVI